MNITLEKVAQGHYRGYKDGEHVATIKFKYPPAKKIKVGSKMTIYFESDGQTISHTKKVKNTEHGKKLATSFLERRFSL